jgi:mannose-6-phosphate isomerase-like protein (cupin superfamily)
MLKKISIITLIGLLSFSCQKVKEIEDKDIQKEEVVLKDYGPEPMVLDIEAYTLANENFRTVLWTTDNLQLTLMSIPVGGEIGLELHNTTEQFLRIEEGKGKVMMGDAEDNLDFVKEVTDDDVVLVPKGKWHNIKNIGDKPLKIYSLYSPKEHPHGTIHKEATDEVHNH